jgi:hypothetical protein
MSYLTLASAGKWETILQPLNAEDIRSLSISEDDSHHTSQDGLGEGHRTLSWIWILAGATDSETSDMHEGKFILYGVFEGLLY